MKKNYRFMRFGIFVIIAALMFAACSLKFSGLFERKAKKDVRLEEENVSGLGEKEILEVIERYAAATDMEAANARFNESTWEVEKEKPGKKVNVKNTLKAVLAAGEGEKVGLAVEEIKPSVTSDMLKPKIVEIGRCITPLLNRTEPRVNNIELASQKINCKVLAPGEEFSFNNTVGRRTEAEGYEEAPIIIRTEDGPQKGYGVGGGVCQLSSTIYNAVDEAGLEVTERHMHSKDVGYVPKGEDATVAYGKVDFRFRNNRQFPVMIKTSVDEDSVEARILEKRE